MAINKQSHIQTMEYHTRMRTNVETQCTKQYGKISRQINNIDEQKKEDTKEHNYISIKYKVGKPNL